MIMLQGTTEILMGNMKRLHVCSAMWRIKIYSIYKRMTNVKNEDESHYIICKNVYLKYLQKYDERKQGIIQIKRDREIQENFDGN